MNDILALDRIDDEIQQLLAEAAERMVLPRWRALDPDEIREKGPGDLVTVVDHAVEHHLTATLPALVGASLVVGEEAVAADPRRMDALDGDTPVWLVDPIDGTGNFARGEPHFAIMIALCWRNRVIAAWIDHPATGDRYHARAGEGAWEQTSRGPALAAAGRQARARITASTSATELSDCTAGIYTGFLPADVKSKVEPALPLFASNFVYMCAGFEYAALARGAKQIAMAWRLLPWDHAPGMLLAHEAGCHVATPGGEPYRPANRRPGLLTATTAPLWCKAQAALGFASPGCN